MTRRSGAEARAAVLTAANDIFVRTGYQSATLEQIGHAVGMTRAAVLYHFPSKEAILHAVTDPFLRAMEEYLAALPVPDRPSPAEQRALVDGLVDLLITYRSAARLTHRFTTESTALGIGARTVAITASAVQRLRGRTGGCAEHMQAVAAWSCLIGTVAARVPVPLESPEERRALAEAALRVLIVQ